MNNLAYSSQKSDEIAQKVEDLLRKELGGSSPLPFQIEDGGASKTNVGAIFEEGLALLAGGKDEVTLFSVVFDLDPAKKARLRVHMNRQGIGCHAGSLLYTADLPKRVSGECSLGKKGFLSGAKFEGPEDVVGKLNANTELLKLCDKFARTEGNSGGIKLTIPRTCKLIPAASGSSLVITTLPRSTSMGFGASMDAKDFLNIVHLVEGSL